MATKTPAKKKTTVSKKPATKKTVSKTAAATKTPVAKKTTAKPAITKKTTTSKPPVAAKTSSVEISVNGNKLIGTLQKEFNKKYPYLGIIVCDISMKALASQGLTIHGLPLNITLASVRRADSGGDISISGNKKISTLEKEFETVFGLCVFVWFTEKEGSQHYTSGISKEKTLTTFNKECESAKCQKCKK